MKPVIKVIKYVAIGGIAILGGIFIAGAVKGATDHVMGDKSFALKQALNEHCNCESVDQIVYLKGAQYSTQDGLSTERAEYQLNACDYEDLQKEVMRLNEVLKKEVHGYDDLDLLKLEFVGAEQHETVIIKNGKVQ